MSATAALSGGPTDELRRKCRGRGASTGTRSERQWCSVVQQRNSAAVFRIVTRWEGRARGGEQFGVVGDTIRCSGGWKDESFRQKIGDKIDTRQDSATVGWGIFAVGVRTLPSSRRLGVPRVRARLSHVARRAQLLGASGCCGIRLGSQRLPPL